MKGIIFNKEDVSWERQNSEGMSRNGKIDYTESWSRPAFAMRIEADGYLPEERKGFTLEDREVNFEIRLKKAPNISFTISKPDGTPAGEVKGYLVLAGQNLNPQNDIDAHNWACPEATADAKGKLVFSAQTDDFMLVVLCEAGYAEIPQSSIPENGEITLAAWGRVEGTLTIDNKPAINEKVSIEPPQGGMVIPRRGRSGPMVFHHYDTRTDAQGKFKFDHVPAGSMKIYRREDVPLERGMFRINQLMAQQIDVSAGETTTVSMGDGAGAGK